jgi:hypothetical protein
MHSVHSVHSAPVTEVSAMFVATMQRRTPGGAGENTRACNHTGGGGKRQHIHARSRARRQTRQAGGWAAVQPHRRLRSKQSSNSGQTEKERESQGRAVPASLEAVLHRWAGLRGPRRCREAASALQAAGGRRHRWAQLGLGHVSESNPVPAPQPSPHLTSPRAGICRLV